ncbi:MAG: Fur family transcriptional regulator [Leptospiraceae bacterium]|nr:Fur family transcriptional regulator [Leptospiraceae bacterium]MCZ8347224.1 Fur family transcriptional regulator [Leptospiraceae bacterium]
MDPKYEKTWRRLDAAGIRSTSQRLEMAHLLLSKPQHLTADEVFGLINSHFPHASRATIFNNLKLFVEKGVIGTLELKSGKMFYDSNLDHHHHALDEATGQIIDIDLDPELEQRVQENLREDFLKKTGKEIFQPSLIVTLKGKY